MRGLFAFIFTAAILCDVAVAADKKSEQFEITLLYANLLNNSSYVAKPDNGGIVYNRYAVSAEYRSEKTGLPLQI